jgi:hypothetical protein
VKGKLDRRVLAAAILVCWLVGIGALVHRRRSVSSPERLAAGALSLEPATYYYTVLRGDSVLGSATSAIDTGTMGFRARNTVRLPSRGARGAASIATSVAYLSRAFVLDSFTVSASGLGSPFYLHGVPAGNSKLLLPSLAPIALILSGHPSVGTEAGRWLYNPVARRVQHVTLRIAAESLFSVVDSAVFDSAAHAWKPAHLDTVRSWKVTTPSHGISAWVDARGRIVAATEPGGVSLRRTTYEIAVLNPKLRIR